MDEPIVVALLVIVSIYFFFLFIRLFADIYMAGVAIVCAVIAFNIPAFYPEASGLLQDIGILKILHLSLPEQPDTTAIYTIAGLIVLCGVLICLPVLPFSATYRWMLGVERISRKEEAKIRYWIQEEIERTMQDDDE
ncbi:hypothetical protein BegalDRAFT_2687 [Beggiatoa alba B18LD]|uniref:Uncharacterized protein n=1 Tax=Beggiatoa alba B18LD TaxID=395493 RepID=I3CIT5_9GAMM|nr:hypothetical protein [Beggiatoa alba]EIJ43528.1 hypothetical protein BegalDRAFT_2687 [Beggiatoa alba B18LD]